MDPFLDQPRDLSRGSLSGFDPILFRATLRSISYRDGLDRFLGAQGVLYTEFGDLTEDLTDRIKAHALPVAAAAGRPYVYLASAAESQGESVRRIIPIDGITKGLVCAPGGVEPCRS